MSGELWKVTEVVEKVSVLHYSKYSPELRDPTHAVKVKAVSVSRGD